MNFVLYHSRRHAGLVSLMDEESAYHLRRLESLKAPTAEVKRYYGELSYQHDVANVLLAATVLEQTRDKRAIAALKQQYKEVC